MNKYFEQEIEKRPLWKTIKSTHTLKSFMSVRNFGNVQITYDA